MEAKCGGPPLWYMTVIQATLEKETGPALIKLKALPEKQKNTNKRAHDMVQVSSIPSTEG